jgi:hypothetical protein
MNFYDNVDVDLIADKNILGEETKGFDFTPLDEYEKITEGKPSVKLPKKLKKLKNPLEIIAYPTNKSKIVQRPLMKADIIPRHPSAVIFNGKSGSGKSNLMVNLLSRPEFYGKTNPKDKKSGYFDVVFLFSPTANGGDDLVKFLEIPKKRIFTDFDKTKLDRILDLQDSIVTDKGLDRSPKMLIIFEDIQSDSKFMNTKSFLRCFIQGRHMNVSTFLCGQSWTLTPRKCRLQANNIFFFPSANSEVEILLNEFCPPHCDKKDFAKVVKYCTAKPYNFLSINMRVPPDQRYRHNLDVIVNPCASDK